MIPATKAGIIRAALAEGPATTQELVAELGMARNYVAAQLAVMVRRGSVKKKPFLGNDGRTRCLWSLGRADGCP